MNFINETRLIGFWEPVFSTTLGVWSQINVRQRLYKYLGFKSCMTLNKSIILANYSYCLMNIKNACTIMILNNYRWHDADQIAHVFLQTNTTMKHFASYCVLFLRVFLQTEPGCNIKTVFPGMGMAMLKMRRLRERQLHIHLCVVFWIRPFKQVLCLCASSCMLFNMCLKVEHQFMLLLWKSF